MEDLLKYPTTAPEGRWRYHYTLGEDAPLEVTDGQFIVRNGRILFDDGDGVPFDEVDFETGERFQYLGETP